MRFGRRRVESCGDVGDRFREVSMRFASRVALGEQGTGPVIVRVSLNGIGLAAVARVKTIA